MNRLPLVLVALLLAGSGCLSSKPPPAADSPHAEPDRVGTPIASGPIDNVSSNAAAPWQASACFDVQVPKDPLAQSVPVHGTLFAPARFSSSTPVVVLLHGGGTPSIQWDGGGLYGVVDGTTLPRALAGAGYAVLTYDRVGYAGSPYIGGSRTGYDLDLDAQSDVHHQILQDLRRGTYGLTDGDCANGSKAGIQSATVVQGGLSLGGVLAIHYALTYHDTQGLLILAGAGFATAPEFDAALAQCSAKTMDATTGYLVPWCSYKVCEDLFVYVPGADRAAIDAECLGIEDVRAPAGESTLFRALVADNHENLDRMDDIPVLLEYNQYDRAANFGNGSDDDSQVAIELAYWRQQCGCKDQVSNFTLPDSGHVPMFQRSHSLLNDRVIAWLGEAGFQPTL
jgi:pimeloyl-ACP methyl ester carboxylesterase